MREALPETSITRRGFFGLASATLASAGLAGSANAAATHPSSAIIGRDLDEASSRSKIALEEHFTLAEIIEDSYAVKDLPPATRSKILDLGAGRLADMDRGGLELCILSLTAPGIQSVPETSNAVALARRVNDHLAETSPKIPNASKASLHCPCKIRRLRRRN